VKRRLVRCSPVLPHPGALPPKKGWKDACVQCREVWRYFVEWSKVQTSTWAALRNVSHSVVVPGTARKLKENPDQNLWKMIRPRVGNTCGYFQPHARSDKLFYDISGESAVNINRNIVLQASLSDQESQLTVTFMITWFMSFIVFKNSEFAIDSSKSNRMYHNIFWKLSVDTLF